MKKTNNGLVNAFVNSVERDFQIRLTRMAGELHLILNESVIACKISRSAMKAAYVKNATVMNYVKYVVKSMDFGNKIGTEFQTIVMLDNGEFYGFADAAIFKLEIKNGKLLYSTNNIVTYDCAVKGYSRLSQRKIAIRFEVSEIFIEPNDRDSFPHYSDEIIIK